MMGDNNPPEALRRDNAVQNLFAKIHILYTYCIVFSYCAYKKKT